jgi:hypothetical protein
VRHRLWALYFFWGLVLLEVLGIVALMVVPAASLGSWRKPDFLFFSFLRLEFLVIVACITTGSILAGKSVNLFGFALLGGLLGVAISIFLVGVCTVATLTMR